MLYILNFFLSTRLPTGKKKKDEIEIIKHCRKNLLFYKDETWVKKINSDFDVPMGAYDSAEISELCGITLLYEIKQELGELELGVYRDDGLMVSDKSKPEIERIRKRITEVFKRNGLKLDEASIISTRTDFLDIVLDLKENTYAPYCKPNNEIKYVHADSNHPPSTIKQIPNIIENRLRMLSSNKSMFDKNKEIY